MYRRARQWDRYLVTRNDTILYTVSQKVAHRTLRNIFAQG